MSVRKSSAKGRVGAIAPVDHALVKILAGIREKNFRSSSDGGRFNLTAREMLVLGRLKSSWKDVVGIQLAHKTCPTRLLRGKLYLSVADSQWLQTLIFVKGRILEKLLQIFPELKITDVIGRPGIIPEEVEELVNQADWPDWHEVEKLSLKGDLDEELAEQINRCRQRLVARNQGLLQKGYRVCRVCKSSLTSSNNQVCAFCASIERGQTLKPVKELLKEMPWLSFDEVSNFHDSLKSYEYEAIKAELLEECCELVFEFSQQLKESFDEETLVLMKKEMVRAIMLHANCMPDQVDLYHLQPDQIVDSEWPALLNSVKEEEVC
jgi:hypothetical protein